MLKNTLAKQLLEMAAAILMVGNLLNIQVFAETLKDHYFGDENASTASESWDGRSSNKDLHEIELTGSDEIQNKQATQLVNISEYQKSYEVEVYASLPSEFTVSIPKIITLDATGETETNFTIGVKGILAPRYAVTSTVDSNLEMTNTRDARQKFNASITTYTDSLTLSYGWELLASDIYNGDSIGFYRITNEKAPVPGSYTGTFDVHIDLVDLSMME